MKAASLAEIKHELITLQPDKILELCIQLAKFKKENKELLSYILFQSHNEHDYVEEIKKEINDQFINLPKNNIYIAKKGLRKILKAISKYSKHVAKKESEVEMIIHFCQNLNDFGISSRSNKNLQNFYNGQIKKLNTLISQIHEDLQFDYKKQLEQLKVM